MPKFTYSARTKDGKAIRDVEDALSRDEAIARLKARGLFIVSISEMKKPEARPSNIAALFQRKGKRRSVKLFDLALFARNLFTTLSSGVTLLRSLEIIAQQTESAGLEKTLQQCAKYVKEGLSLSEALAKYPNVFPPLWKGIVEVGETSGNLPYVMEKLAEYLEVRMEFERRVKSALVYPAIIFVAAMIAMLVFFKFILPKFSVIFDQFAIDLPLITKIMFGISKLIEKYTLLVIAGLVAGVYFIRRSFKNPETRKFWDRTGLKVPIIGELIFIACLERFTSSVAILLESGLPLVSTLETSAHAMNNSHLEKGLLYVRDRVRDGGSLSGEFAKLEVLPPLLSEMAKIGEETGTLPQIFSRVSTHYRRELSTRVDRLISAFEPLMIIVMGIIIGIIVISLYLPLFKLSTLGGKSMGM